MHTNKKREVFGDERISTIIIVYGRQRRYVFDRENQRECHCEYEFLPSLRCMVGCTLY